MSLLNEVSILGFNDSEIPELRNLAEGIKSGEIDPSVALEHAYEIKNSKQDYH